jgi:3',5'-cyclic AMP phosphodiesterase CpdA
MRIFHLTDLHLGAPGSRGAEAIARVCRDVTCGSDVVCITGDLTDAGTEAQYAEALALLRPLAGHLLLAPGNHDYSGPLSRFGVAGVTYSREAEDRYIDLCSKLYCPRPGTPWMHMGGDWISVALDSCHKSDAALARGNVGSAQLARLREAIAQATKHKLRLLVAYHHDVADTDPTLALDDGDALLALAWPTAHVVLSGHTHGPAREWTSTEGVRGLWRRGQDAFGGGAASVWMREVG